MSIWKDPDADSCPSKSIKGLLPLYITPLLTILLRDKLLVTNASLENFTKIKNFHTFGLLQFGHSFNLMLSYSYFITLLGLTLAFPTTLRPPSAAVLDSELRNLQIKYLKSQLEKNNEGFWHRLLNESLPDSVLDILSGTLSGTLLIWIGILCHRIWTSKHKPKTKTDFQQAQLPERKISVV